MRILVTGCAGYVGSVLTRYLIRRGHHVIGLDNLMYGIDSLLGVLDHPRFLFVHGDIQDEDICSKVVSKANAVVHLAAIVGESTVKKYDLFTVQDVNSYSVSRLARLGGFYDHSFLFASTCSVYGQSQGMVDESSDIDPVGVYGETKAGAERAVLTLGGTVLRLATVFGRSPRVRLDTTFNQFVHDAIVNRRLEVWGPHLWRPFVHIWDVCHAIRSILELSDQERAGQVFNIGGYNTTKGQLAQMIEGELGDDNVEIILKEPSPNSRDYRVNFHKVHELPWKTSYTLDDGIKEMIDTVRLLRDPSSGYWRNT